MRKAATRRDEASGARIREYISGAERAVISGTNQMSDTQTHTKYKYS